MDLRADGNEWAIATPHAAATSAGAAAFERGGTAMDAALHAATTLAVVYPHMCGIGGDLFALVQQADGEARAIASSGRSPAAADVAALAGLDTMPIRGSVPITVPGAVAGWRALHEMGGVLPWSDAFDAATGLAQDGMVVSRSLAGALEDDRDTFVVDPGLSSVFYPGGEPAGLGGTVAQAALGRTLTAIAAEGPAALYGGAVGAAYAAGLAAIGAPITLEDLAAHRAVTVAPMRASFRGLHVSVAPPNSQGFVLLQLLALLDRLGIDPDLDGSDAARIARSIEAVNGDRDRHLADPDRMRMPASALLEDAHLDGLAAEAGDPEHHGAPIEGAVHPDGDTIALVAADAAGNAVSLIQSLFWSFGAGILEPGTGIVAQNRGACFSLAADHPNRFAPGVRPFHTLMPVLVHDDRGLVGVAGTMGGYQQPQINLHTITRAFVHDAHPADAVAAPRWAVYGADEGRARPVVAVEPGVPPTTRDRLGAAYPIVDEEGGIGHAHLIRRRGRGFAVGSDPRADGAAAAG